MSLRYLLDTNICVYVRRQRPPSVLARFAALEAGAAAISVVTWGELLYGAEKSARRDDAVRVLEEFVSLVPVLPMPPEAGRHYGLVRADLSRRGEVIGNNDLWIAAHALAADLVLVTNNEREFGRVTSLRVENWTN
ncbi:MAG: PIN domain-containing protein [Alphaproteobacteria bacterium]|nr:PIN domain-containing protein [Alphaproteobacteria bacterium]